MVGCPAVVFSSLGAPRAVRLPRTLHQLRLHNWLMSVHACCVWVCVSSASGSLLPPRQHERSGRCRFCDARYQSATRRVAASQVLPVRAVCGRFLVCVLDFAQVLLISSCGSREYGSSSCSCCCLLCFSLRAFELMPREPSCIMQSCRGCLKLLISCYSCVHEPRLLFWLAVCVVLWWFRDAPTAGRLILRRLVCLYSAALTLRVLSTVFMRACAISCNFYRFSGESDSLYIQIGSEYAFQAHRLCSELLNFVDLYGERTFCSRRPLVWR